VVLVQALYLTDCPTPPHSSHDGFSLVPQLQKLATGRVPDDPAMGMFEGTWFPPETEPPAVTGWRPWAARLLGNVRPHTWVDSPHPLALASAVTVALPGRPLVPAWVITGYFLVLLLALYLIGSRVRSRRVGLLAATLGAGCPGLFGMSRYVETHLPVVVMATVVVALLLHLDQLRRWGLCLLLSVVAWSLTRTGEAAGEVIIGGLLVAGPGLWVLWQSRGVGALKVWLVGLTALVLPFLLLADLAFLKSCMESVTRAFADPSVQTDVVEKGGPLGSVWTWRLSYLILLGTDYLAPLLSLFLPLAGWGLVRVWKAGELRQRGVLVLWLLVPLVALSWMQRKAGWYGIGLIPPVVLLMAIGLDGLARWRRVAVGGAVLVALVQLVLGSLLPQDAVPDALARVRQPIPVHDWRLRRVDLLRPVDTPEAQKLVAHADALVAWLDAHHPPNGDLISVAAIVRGSGPDYPLRYRVSLSRPDVDIVNLTDPRAREIGYRGFLPGDFVALIYVADGFAAWPPPEADRTWLSSNLHCKPGDALDPFLAGLLRRGLEDVGASVPIYQLGPGLGGVLGPGRRWVGDGRPVGGETPLCGP